MASWYLRTRPRRRRVSWVKDFAVTEFPPVWNQYSGKHDVRKDVTVTWAHTAEERKTFATRTLALAFRDHVVASGFTWAKRWVAVNAERKPRPDAPFKPRQNAEPTVEESRRLHAAIDSATALAAEHGLRLPAFARFVTTSKRSCRGGARRGLYYIAIARWAFEHDAGEKPGYLTYIVAHELAHVADVYHTGATSHGPQFMAHLRKLCPLHLQAYELNYKPSEARRAGISTRDAAPEVAAAVNKARTRFVMPTGDQLAAMIERAKAIAAQIAASEGK